VVAGHRTNCRFQRWRHCSHTLAALACRSSGPAGATVIAYNHPHRAVCAGRRRTTFDPEKQASRSPRSVTVRPALTCWGDQVASVKLLMRCRHRCPAPSAAAVVGRGNLKQRRKCRCAHGAVAAWRTALSMWIASRCWP
jgi:hypothetical protein